MNWYLDVLKNYAVFGGRARRKEYWMFFLVNLMVSFVIDFIEGMFGGPGIIAMLYSLAVLTPGFAVTIRRFHDTGRSGWWLLIGLVPVIGAIALFVFAVQDSSPGANQFGPNPKLETA